MTTPKVLVRHGPYVRKAAASNVAPLCLGGCGTGTFSVCMTCRENVCGRCLAGHVCEAVR